LFFATACQRTSEIFPGLPRRLGRSSWACPISPSGFPERSVTTNLSCSCLPSLPPLVPDERRVPELPTSRFPPPYPFSGRAEKNSSCFLFRFFFRQGSFCVPRYSCYVLRKPLLPRRRAGRYRFELFIVFPPRPWTAFSFSRGCVLERCISILRVLCPFRPQSSWLFPRRNLRVTRTVLLLHDCLCTPFAVFLSS